MKLIAVYVLTQALTAVWLRRGWGGRNYSQRLSVLNTLLLILFFCLVLLRYAEELAICLGYKDSAWEELALVLAPVYGAVLVAHVAVNHQFFTKGPLRAPVITWAQRCSATLLYRFCVRLYHAVIWRLRNLKF